MQPSANPSCTLSSIFSSAPVPALPQSAVQVLELCQDTEVAPGDLAKPIELDAALVLQVMRFLNSSYFGFQREIRSVQQGLALVGVRAIKNFVLWTAVFSATPDPKCSALVMQCFRRDALRRALLAKAALERQKVPHVDEVFTAALLQDIAVPFLARELPQDYQLLLAQRQDGRIRLSVLEQERFGWTHADAACFLFERWNLPNEFGVLVREHIKPDDRQADRDPANMALKLSATLPAERDSEWFDYDLFRTRLYQFGCSSVEQTTDFLMEVDQAFESVAVNMKVGKPDRLLADRHLEACDEVEAASSEAHGSPAV